MDMPNEYYNQGRRRGNRPNDMFYQTPMGGGNMSGPVATFPNSTPMGGGGVGNHPLHPTPMSTPNINRNPNFGNWPGNMRSPTRIPGGPLQESPLQAPNFPTPPIYDPPMPKPDPLQGTGGGGTGGVDMPWNPPPISGDRGGTRIPGGPLQESPLGGGMPGVRSGAGGQMGGGMSRPRTGGGQDAGGVLPFGHGRNVGSGPAPGPGTDASMPAQRSYSSSYNPNTNRNRNTTNRYSTGGNMNANRMRGGYNRNLSGPNSRYNPLPNQYYNQNRYRGRRGGGSYDTGGLYSPGSGGYFPGGHYDRYPRSPGMPSFVTNRNYDNRRISNRNYDQRKTYNTQTFNEGDTSIQGPRIAKKMGRMQGYNPMMHASQSRQIGGLRNLQRMLAAMRGGRR